MSNFTLRLVMSDRPIIFISAVSRELHTTRDLVAKTLYSQAYDPKWEDIANSDPGNLLATIRDWIDQSVGVIQLVGHCYGGQTDVSDPSHGLLSYTQYEAVYARQKALPVWYIILSAQHPTDGCGCQPNTLHDLQSKYRDAVRSYGDRYFPSDNRDQTKIVVLELKDELKSLRAEAEKRHQKLQGDVTEVKNGVSNLERMMIENTAPGRLAAYKRSLLAAFRPYQELAIDNYAAAEQAAPNIWDIFVHPGCSVDHLRPEEMDVAQREMPPRLPAQDLLPLLAQDDYRRTVLLADPGMGKSTLIQSLIAYLANERPLSGADELTGLLPVPLVLRDLVPLLPLDSVENWNWDGLLTVLIEHYQRDETSAPLCDCFKNHRNEFLQLIRTDAKVFFLIDGLDEIGDLTKRRQIAQCIKDGIRTSNKDARWLITSRVIGYEDAPVDFVSDKIKVNLEGEYVGEADVRRMEEIYKHIRDLLRLRWGNVELKGLRVNYGKVGFIPEAGHAGLPLNATSAANAGWRKHESSTKASVWASLPIAQRLHLAPFDDKRQDDFTQRWFKKPHSADYSRELMREVRAHHHDGVRIISRVPNLLCMMNILKRSGKPLPDGRAALYDAIVQAYLGGIDSAYRLRPILGHTCPFDAPQRRFLLALLGAHMQFIRTMRSLRQSGNGKKPPSRREQEFGGTILISKREIATFLEPSIQRMLDGGRVKNDHSASELLDELLHHIASRSGLLIPRSSDADGNTLYGFTHLSFMEFFAAEWLGLEFDRQRNRIVRRTLALEENQPLSDADLDREFPPQSAIQHSRESFKDLPTLPTWHEALIFLLESRKADAPTLLRWLYPALHNHKSHTVNTDNDNPIPLLPLDAIQLAVDLALDPEIPLLATTRQQWWRTLWFAYLTWPFHPAAGEESTQWPIAPLLLGCPEYRTEAIEALITVYSSPELTALPPEEKGSQAATRSLFLFDCAQLTSSDLAQLTALSHLKKLLLNRCVGLETLPDLSKLKKLEVLYLPWCKGLSGPNAFDALSALTELRLLMIRDCPGLTRLPELGANRGLKILDLMDNTGIHGSDALNGLTKLAKLEFLGLSGCTGLERLPDLSGLQCLKYLKLNGCTGLKGVEVFNGLGALEALEKLEIIGCTGLANEDVASLRKKLGQKCEIVGP